MLLALSVEGPILRTLGFGEHVERGPRSGQLLRIRLDDDVLLHASAIPHTPAAEIGQMKSLGQPSGLATCAGRVYVADADKDCVHILDALSLRRPAGLSPAEAVIGSRGTARGNSLLLRQPHGLAVSASAQHLYVCDRAQHRVCVYSLGGAPVRCFGRKGRRPGEFSEPVAIALGRWRVYVAEGRRLQVLSLLGKPLQALMLPGLSPLRGLALSGEAAFGSAQRLFVSVGRGGLHVVNVGTAALAPP